MTEPVGLPYGAGDLIVLRRSGNPPRRWRHVAGVGAGAHPLGDRGPDDPLFKTIEGPWSLDNETCGHMFAGYYARSALAGLLPDGRIVVVGSRDGQLALPPQLDAASVAAELSAALRQVPRGLRTGHQYPPELPDSPHWDYDNFIAGAAAMVRAETAAYAYNTSSGNNIARTQQPGGTPASFVLLVGDAQRVGVACDPELGAWLAENGSGLAQQLERARHRIGNELGLSNTTTLYGEQIRQVSPALADAGVHALAFGGDGSGRYAVFGNATDNPRGFTLAEGELIKGAMAALLYARRGYGGVSTDREAAQNWAVGELAAERPVTVIRAREFTSEPYLTPDEAKTAAFVDEADRAIRGAGGASVVEDSGHEGVGVVGYLPANSDAGLEFAGRLLATYADRYPYNPAAAGSGRRKPPDTVNVAVSPATAIFSADSTANQTIRRRGAADALAEAEVRTARDMNQQMNAAPPASKRTLWRPLAGGGRRKGRPGKPRRPGR